MKEVEILEEARMTPRDLWRENMRKREIAKREAIRLRRLASMPEKPPLVPLPDYKSTVTREDAWRRRDMGISASISHSVTAPIMKEKKAK